jgi:dTDP-4-dehydrorhamnose 3,5-epimerase
MKKEDRISMDVRQTRIEGAYVITMPEFGDERGSFSRFYCSIEMGKLGLVNSFVQINHSSAKQAGTVRGLHYQRGEHAETKVLRCIRGAVFDIIVDLRPASPTYCKWFGTTLSDSNRETIYVPKGCAHGIVTMTEAAEILYLVDTFYAPSAEGGIRYDDPLFKVELPIVPTVVSAKDSAWPDFDPDVGV